MSAAVTVSPILEAAARLRFLEEEHAALTALPGSSPKRTPREVALTDAMEGYVAVIAATRATTLPEACIQVMLAAWQWEGAAASGFALSRAERRAMQRRMRRLHWSALDVLCRAAGIEPVEFGAFGVGAGSPDPWSDDAGGAGSSGERPC